MPGLSMDGGTLQRLPPNATREQQIAVLNDVIERLNSLLKTQIFADATSKRLLIGYQPSGWGPGIDFGIKMSIDGVDVTKATDDQLLFSMSIDAWTWRNGNGEIMKQFVNETGTDSYYDGGRNYVNIGLRKSPATKGFEMAKPGVDLGNEPI
jgi:hypothetical protein